MINKGIQTNQMLRENDAKNTFYKVKIYNVAPYFAPKYRKKGKY